MTFRPRTFLEPCLECGNSPEPTIRGFFKAKVRMECKCGVSGAWRDYTGGDPWHDAVNGWRGAKIERGPPPHPQTVSRTTIQSSPA